MKKNQAIWRVVGQVLFMVLLVAFVAYILDHSMKEIFVELAEMSNWVLVGVLAMGLGFLLIEGWNIQRFVAYFQPLFRWRDGFWAYGYSAFCRVVSFGSATSISEVLYYQRKKVDVQDSIGLMILHMLFYKLGLLVWSLIAFISLSTQLWHAGPERFGVFLFGILTNGLFVTVLLLAVFQPQIIQWSVGIAKRLRKTMSWQAKCDHFLTEMRQFQTTLEPFKRDFGWWGKGLLLNALKLSFWFIVPYIFLRSDHPDLGFFTSLALTALCITTAGVIPSPAGIGSLELVFLWMFKPYVGVVDTVSALLLYRFASYVLPFIIGLIYEILYKRRKIKEDWQKAVQERKEGDQAC